eukprot:9468955-Pyramimonas_sp.AAC.1
MSPHFWFCRAGARKDLIMLAVVFVALVREPEYFCIALFLICASGMNSGPSWGQLWTPDMGTERM